MPSALAEFCSEVLLACIHSCGARAINYIYPLIPFVGGWALLLLTHNFASIGLVNGLLQLTLFSLVVCIPIWKTARMSYVDIGWPLGLMVVGLLTWNLSDGNAVRTALVSIAYLCVGGRMGFGILKMWREGRLQKEFPRYEYQKLRWAAAGKTNTALAMQVDALWQGLANASFLAMPAFIIAANTSAHLHPLEILGLLIWLVAFFLESIADLQKLAFLRKAKKAGHRNTVCDAGLWKYSRHPNYFFEWMVWNGLVVAAIPSWIASRDTESIAVWFLLGAGLLFASYKMYSTLVHHTGAIPSEYYSVLKRPGYKKYQESTNMFFPGPKK